MSNLPFLRKPAFGLCLTILCLLRPLAADAGSYSQDFSAATFPSGTALVNGTTVVLNGGDTSKLSSSSPSNQKIYHWANNNKALQLLGPLGASTASWRMPLIDSTLEVQGFDAFFNAEVFRSSATAIPGAGWSFNFGAIPVSGDGSGEGGFTMPNGITIAWDLFNSGGSDLPSIEVFCGGVSVGNFVHEAYSGGTFTLTNPATGGTTAAITYTPGTSGTSASTVQAAMRLVSGWGSVTVTGNAGGPWTVDRITVGAYATPIANAANLLPAGSAMTFKSVRPGTASLSAKWTFPDVLTDTPLLDDGAFTVTNPTTSLTTAPIPFNADGAAVQAAMRAISGWTAVTVTGNAGGPWNVDHGVVGAYANPVSDAAGLLPANSSLAILSTTTGTASLNQKWSVTPRPYRPKLVNIHWDYDGLDLTYGGRTIFTNLWTPGFIPAIGNTFAFSARNESSNTMNFFIDDLVIGTTLYTDTGGPVISEFMANNSKSLDDEDGDSSDWIEIYNGQNASVDLSGYRLTNVQGNNSMWAFPSVTMAPYAYKVVFASAKNRKVPSGTLHTNFTLQKESGYLALIKPDGVTKASEFIYGAQYKELSYGIKGPTTNKGYLFSPTPGAVNSVITTSLGPLISNTTDKPTQPTGGPASAPLVISTTIGTTLRPLASSAPVTLRWRRMYENENAITMVDNGTNGDAVANDKIYTCSIPTTSLLPGEMIRWRILAKDNSTTPIYSFDPPYPPFLSSPTNPQTNPVPDATTEAEQYFGTITIPAMEGNTPLPVLHWFLNEAAGNNTENNTGSRCSFFWQPLPLDPPPVGYTPPKPRFYDNVLVNIHGQSSQGFPKKSHDLSFSKDNKFLWKDGTPSTAGVNLLGNFADKSKVRNDTVWWVWEKSGHIASHYSTHIRVQRNNAFRGTYDLVENGNSTWLKRLNLDNEGALYKVYDDLSNANNSEKKNPDNADNSDLTALINGLNPGLGLTARLKYLYDNVNVAALINDLATHSLILNRDFGHKNYYMYRDTHGTQEWSILPWDQDLSLGHTWTGAQNYFDDDIHSQAALQIGVQNRLIELAYATPELNQMFVRRLRTLADQFLISSTETNGPIAQHINALMNKIDPNLNNTASGTDDADLEARAWGYWLDGYAGGNIAYTGPDMAVQTARKNAERITIANPIPPYPGGPPYDDGTATTFPFLIGRRDFFYSAVPPTSGAMAFPTAQPLNPNLIIEQVNQTPTTGNYQDQEYFVLRNPNNYAVDISGWTIGGDISMTFQGGTVIPAQGAATTQATNATYVNQLVVANNPAGFRTRSTSPTKEQYRQVAGPYDHQLSARGGTINLNRPNDPLNPAAGFTQVKSLTFTGTPTTHQQYLRITELNFRPAPATSAELAQVPGLTAGNFEFVELQNTGPAVLDLGGAYFEEGINFTFPKPFLLNPNQRCLIVSNLQAFQVRYGNSLLVAGEFSDSLDNGGETLRLLDPLGEEILSFYYDDDWYPVPAGQYRTFIIRQPLPTYTDYGMHASWQLSDQQNGSPADGDTAVSVVYEGWRYDYFSDAQLPTLLNPNLAAAPLQDPDQDGCNNLEEYAFGSNPTLTSSKVEVTPGLITIGPDKFLTLTFKRPVNAIDLNYFVECSDSLSGDSWYLDALPVDAPVSLGNGLEQVTYRDTIKVTDGPRRFMRATAVKQ